MDRQIQFLLRKLFGYHWHDWEPWQITSSDKVVRAKDKGHVGYITFMKRQCNTCHEVELKCSKAEL